MIIGNAELHLIDCMDYMRGLPDKAFELAIVDPPYFDRGGDPAYYRSRVCQSDCKPITETWGIPEGPYFAELFRVSRKQIIWGVNYYAQFIPHFSRIVWDKVNDGTPFSQADIASYSEGVKVYMFRYKWNGMIQANMKNKELRIHPTQKPIALYQYLLANFAKEGDRILDTHLGSGSSAIACNNLGFSMVGCELDADYYAAACQRVSDAQRQSRMFA